MPIVKITKKDLDRNKPFEPGYRLCTQKGTREELTKDKKSINILVDFEVKIDEENDTREFTKYFSTKALGMLEPYIAAIQDAPVEPDKEVNLDLFNNCQVYIEFSKEIVRNPSNPNDHGRPMNQIINWSPKSNPPF